MAEDANGSSHGQTLDQLSSEPLPAISKRKPDADPESLDESPIHDDKKTKLLSPEVPEEGAPDPIAAGIEYERKEVRSAVDKGKGILLVEEEEEGEDGEDGELGSDDSDSDDESTDSDDDLWIGGDLDEDTDFDEDPLAEVDLDNILPSRTRRREPPPPGSYLVNDADEEDSDESE